MNKERITLEILEIAGEERIEKMCKFFAKKCYGKGNIYINSLTYNVETEELTYYDGMSSNISDDEVILLESTGFHADDWEGITKKDAIDEMTSVFMGMLEETKEELLKKAMMEELA